MITLLTTHSSIHVQNAQEKLSLSNSYCFLIHKSVDLGLLIKTKIMPRFNKEMFESMKEARGIDFLERNMIVEVDGKKGKVTGNYGHNLLVQFEGEKHSGNCHPYWRVKYFNSEGVLIKEYKDE